MTKQKFIDKIDETCKTLNIPLSYNIEHGLKIINNSIDIDKVNISFDKDILIYDNVLKLSNELFTDTFISEFIDGGGFIKDNKYFYLVVFKELQQDDLLTCLKLLCKKTISYNDQLIDDWFEKYKDGTLTFLSYRLEGNKITSLNLYIK